MKKRSFIRIEILLFIGVMFAWTEALAIPTFARRYATSCATCHQAWPRLNSVGESFRISGFRSAVLRRRVRLKASPVRAIVFLCPTPKS